MPRIVLCFKRESSANLLSSLKFLRHDFVVFLFFFLIFTCLFYLIF